ncbi:MAG: ABC transporter permease, partial [Calditrichaeota bacterium]|nr:ABC transporter permease [Calditrichota bacterium]
MNLPLFIATRYLRTKRRTGFISLITYISAGGIMIGVAALVITLSVMNGFESEVRDRIIGADAHIKVTLFHEMPMVEWRAPLDTLRRLTNVVGATPYVQGKGMIRKGTRIEGIVIKGVDPATVGEVGDLPKTIVAGAMIFRGNSDPKSGTEMPGIILGRQVSFRLDATIGDTVILISPAGLTSLLSTPRLMRFNVTGVFETGIYEYDDAFAHVALADAQEFFEFSNAISGIELRLNRMEYADRVARRIEEVLRYPYFPRTWHDMHQTLFRWMKIEKWLYTILLSLIILVAAFNIVSSQIMVVLEKKREIGILKAIGATQEVILKVFLFEGLIVGVVGTVLGLVLGWALCRAQQTYKFFSLP